MIESNNLATLKVSTHKIGTTHQTAMATNVTLISNTLVNKYLAYDGGNVAIHDFPTHTAGEFLYNRTSVCLPF